MKKDSQPQNEVGSTYMSGRRGIGLNAFHHRVLRRCYDETKPKDPYVVE